jgi:hypothetical protein
MFTIHPTTASEEVTLRLVAVVTNVQAMLSGALPTNTSVIMAVSMLAARAAEFDRQVAA